MGDVRNLIQGPANLLLYRWTGSTYDTAIEPAVADVNNASLATSAWEDQGFTRGGIGLELNRTFTDLEVDQLIDVPDRRLTARNIRVVGNLAEPTLDNLALWLNNSAPSSAAAGAQTLELDSGLATTQPSYVAVMLHGFAPRGASAVARRRVVIVRKCVNVESINLMNSKGDQQVANTAFSHQYVSDAIGPIKIIDGPTS